ncbi:MAG: RNA 2'-phosphotransferase [Candidatus Omnitrophota bacterium]|jgi:putative RNA 2'-phosphotransferase
MTEFRIRLSKFLSYVLRHDPGKYGLKLDKHGCADLEKVLSVLKERFKKFQKNDLTRLVERDPKGRFEISGNKIRATYGHSIEVQPVSEKITPPEVLYHGTSKESADEILKNGLKPMDRQFVHLSVNEDDAYSVGSRHTENPVILEIMAKEAFDDGVEFFKEGHLYLAKEIPAGYIKAEGSYE